MSMLTAFYVGNNQYTIMGCTDSPQVNTKAKTAVLLKPKSACFCTLSMAHESHDSRDTQKRCLQ